MEKNFCLDNLSKKESHNKDYIPIRGRSQMGGGGGCQPSADFFKEGAGW